MTEAGPSEATLMVNDHRIPLSNQTDVAELIDDVTNAAANGGAFVHVEGRHGRAYDVMVNAHTHVVLCHEHVLLNPPARNGPWTLGVSLEY